MTRFRPGDEVFADVMTGGFAEYVCVAEDLLAPKPATSPSSRRRRCRSPR